MINKLFLPFVLLGCVLLVGCSGKQPLSGTVTFADDGTPVTAGAVFFETPTFNAQGSIKSDGTYIVGSTGLTDGIPKGTYMVSIRGAEDVERIAGPGGTMIDGRRRSLINAKYQRPDTSGLTFTVDGRTKKYDIKVER